VVALEHGIARLGKIPICVRLVRELHEKLMTGVRGQQVAPGQFRKTQNWIGKPGSTIQTASFIPPPPGDVEPCLVAWERFLHESNLPPLVAIDSPTINSRPSTRFEMATAELGDC
jgi:Fic family protein